MVDVMKILNWAFFHITWFGNDTNLWYLSMSKLYSLLNRNKVEVKSYNFIQSWIHIVHNLNENMFFFIQCYIMRIGFRTGPVSVRSADMWRVEYFALNRKKIKISEWHIIHYWGTAHGEVLMCSIRLGL